MTTINDYVKVVKPFMLAVDPAPHPQRPRSLRYSTLERVWQVFDALTPEWQAKTRILKGQMVFGTMIWPEIDRDGEIVEGQ